MSSLLLGLFVLAVFLLPIPLLVWLDRPLPSHDCPSRQGCESGW